MSELPEAKVLAPKTKASGVIVGTIMIIATATVVGFIVAYLAALVVVKIGLPAPKLIVGAPLLVVGAIAWATTVGQSLRDGAISVAVAAAIAVALFVAWDPPRPSVLFTEESKVSDVRVHGNDATFQLETKTSLTEMPDAGRLAGYALLLAALAVIATTIGHGIITARKPKTDF
jgi:hypothetical protein